MVRFALGLAAIWSSKDTMLLGNSPGTGSENHERRLMRRFDMRLPAVIRLEMRSDDPQSEQPGEIQTETQNVSARGVFFYLDRRVQAGTRCEVTLTFPPHITLTDAVRVRFTARVIRSEAPLPSLRVGTAAVIEDYEFLRSGARSAFLEEIRWKATN